MSSYGVPLMTLTEKVAPGGGRVLTGRLGHAIIVGLPMEDNPDGTQRWRLTVVTPEKPFDRRGRDGRGRAIDQDVSVLIDRAQTPRQ